MIMTDDEKLRQSLKQKFGLAPPEPTASQLSSIKRAIQRIKDTAGPYPTHSDWENAVHEHCPSAGGATYGGVDNSDLNALLKLAISNARKS